MPYRELGGTGEKVSSIGLGGWHLGLKKVDESLSLRLIRSAIDRGINFMDNSWDYNQGISEIRMGKALRDGYREKVFLMSKIDGRSKKEAARQLDESLRRLQTDRIDLVQHHEILRYEDPHRIFDEEGANAALVERPQGRQNPLHRIYRPQGSAHPSLYARGSAPERISFRYGADAVECDGRSLSQFWEVGGAGAGQERIAVLGMKPMANGIILKSKTVTPIECLHFAMNLPTSVVITGVDSMEILDQAFEAAGKFRPLSDAQLKALLAKTEKAASRGEFEPFKISSIFDSTAENPAWLGEEPERLQSLMRQ